jgi:hypothetical protein
MKTTENECWSVKGLKLHDVYICKILHTVYCISIQYVEIEAADETSVSMSTGTTQT